MKYRDLIERIAQARNRRRQEVKAELEPIVVHERLERGQPDVGIDENSEVSEEELAALLIAAMKEADSLRRGAGRSHSATSVFIQQTIK